MACIYKIINNINEKVYIGKTNFSIEKRWKEHRNDYSRKRNEKRGLYQAMRKYGIENFSIEKIEECSIEQANEREMYWIEYYQSFKNGYNRTKGGNGKFYLNYELILQTYEKVQNQAEVARLLGISSDSVRMVLRNNHIQIKSGGEISKENNSKIVAMLDPDTEQNIHIFPSIREASQFLLNNNHSKSKIRGIQSHIKQVVDGKRKTAYGYKWKGL